MNLNWKFLNHVIPGGTVIDITSDDAGRIWAASTAGLFKKEAGRWISVQQNLPFFQVSALSSVGKTLFAAGAQSGIAYSIDGGETWQRAWIDQVQSPIACFAVSPDYAQDHVLLAGTQGDGILRTTDGGRHWQLSNFGLRGFSVFSLESVPVARKFRELDYQQDLIYAGTDDGVYLSPNGGRAWKAAGTETAGSVVLGLALSPEFQTDQMVYAVTESGTLLISRDGGISWEASSFGNFSTGAVNSIICNLDMTIQVGTSQAGILRSNNQGQNWESPLSNVPPVLKLEKSSREQYAALYQEGLMVSEDGGNTWFPESGFVARRFEWLGILSEDLFIAAGPDEGIFTSADQGSSWTALSSWPDGKTILGLAVGEDDILCAAQDGIWRSTSRGEQWTQLLGAETIAPSIGVLSGRFHLAAQGNIIWCGGENGSLWFSEDKGQTWKLKEAPFNGRMIVSIAPVKTLSEGQGILVGVYDRAYRQIQIWQMQLDGNWTLWFSQESTWFNLVIVPYEERTGKAVLALGTNVYERENEDYQASLSLDGVPITALAVSPDGDTTVLGTMDQSYYRIKGQNWAVIDTDIQGEAMIALQFSPKFELDRVVYGLTSTGKLQKTHIDR